MNRRIARRVTVDIRAEIFCEGKTYDSSIDNVSETGLGYIITSALPYPDAFTTSDIISIRFQIPSGNIFNLTCRPVWLSKSIPYGDLLFMGMKIISPPSEYREWIRSLTFNANI